MEAVLADALKSFVSDILSSDRPCSELSLKIFFIFKTIVGGHDNNQEEQIFCLVKTYLSSIGEIKEQLAKQDSASKCVQILKGQILIRLFFIWVARECLKKDVENDPELKNISDEIVKLCEMFCIRTEPLQLNAFLSDTVMRMFIDYVPDILLTIFDYFLLPLPKELAAAVGNEDGSPMTDSGRSPQFDSSKEPSFDEPSSNNGSNKRRSREGKNSQLRRLVMSPIKSVDNNSSAGRNNNTNRFGKRPSRQILVAARLSSQGSDSHLNGSAGGSAKGKGKIAAMAEASGKVVSSAERRVGMRSQSFDHVGVGLRQAAAALQRQATAPALATSQQPAQTSVRRCLFGESAGQTQSQNRVGYTTPRKRSAAVLMSVADTPPLDVSKKQSKIAPMTPLSKNHQENYDNNNNNMMDFLQKSPAISSPFSKPSSTQFRVITTPLRQLQQQQSVARSPMAPGTVLVPQSPDDSKAGIAARSFYTKPTGPPQSIVQASRRNILTNSNRRTMSSYDFGGGSGNTQSIQPQSSSDTTHFLFADLMTTSPTAAAISAESSSIYHCFPQGAELDIMSSPRASRMCPPNSLEKSQQHALIGSPVIESRSSRRKQPQMTTSSFSVAAGYTCE